MKIAQIYSHLNGKEFLLVHKPNLWDDIVNAIAAVDAGKAFSKISKEKTMIGKTLYSPTALNKLFKQAFNQRGWSESRIYYYVNEDLGTARETVDVRDKQLQKKMIAERGFTPDSTYNQVDFIKDKVALEVQFGKYFSVQQTGTSYSRVLSLRRHRCWRGNNPNAQPHETNVERAGWYDHG